MLNLLQILILNLAIIFNENNLDLVRVAKHSDLKGGLVTSTTQAENEGKNQFSTGTLSYSHIDNQSNHKGSAVGVSAAGDYKGGWNGQRVDKEGKPTHSLSNVVGYGKDQDSQSSRTTSGINTQNLIIKNEQAQRENTGKTAAQIKEGIKTDITTETAESRSGKLENNFDKDKLQKELDYQVKALSDFQTTTVSTINEKVANHAESKRAEAEQAKAAGNTTKARELENEAEKWETGGAYRQGVDAITNAVGLALGGSPTAGVVTGAISPYINTEIKQATEGNTEANLIAHALWGAVEAYAQGGKAGAGAVAAVTGEVGANIISQNLFGKEPENLTEAEKRTVSELSQVAAGLAGGLASGSGSSLSTAQSVKTGQGVGKNAVENNTFGDIHPSDDREQSIKSIAKAMFKGDEEKAEAYYDGLKQGEAKALIEGIEGTVEAVQHFDETIVTIAEALGNPKETVQKVVISLEELNARINSALETNPAEAGELMGYLQSQGKAIQAPTVILTGEVAEKVVRLLKKSPQVDYKSDVNNLGVNSAKFDKELNANILNRVNGSFYNIDAVNKLRKGKLPGDGLDRKTGLPVEGKIGVPRNMPSSKDPDTMAINFAEQFLGRRVTPEEWEAGRKMFKNKDCINCFKVDLGNRQSIVYRSGVNENSSSKTLSGTATLEINTTEIKELNSGEVLKLKFPTSEIGR